MYKKYEGEENGYFCVFKAEYSHCPFAGTSHDDCFANNCVKGLRISRKSANDSAEYVSSFYDNLDKHRKYFWGVDDRTRYDFFANYTKTAEEYFEKEYKYI